MEMAGVMGISSLLGVRANCIAVHDEGYVAVRAVHRSDVKPAGDHDRLSERHLRLMVALELNVNHLIRWRRWNMDARAGEGHEDKLGDLVGIVFKWNHEPGDRDEFIVHGWRGMDAH